MKRQVVDLKGTINWVGWGGGVTDCQMNEQDLYFFCNTSAKIPDLEIKPTLKKNQRLTLSNENEEYLISKTFKTSIW